MRTGRRNVECCWGVALTPSPKLCENCGWGRHQQHSTVGRNRVTTEDYTPRATEGRRRRRRRLGRTPRLHVNPERIMKNDFCAIVVTAPTERGWRNPGHGTNNPRRQKFGFSVANRRTKTRISLNIICVYGSRDGAIGEIIRKIHLSSCYMNLIHNTKYLYTVKREFVEQRVDIWYQQ